MRRGRYVRPPRRDPIDCSGRSERLNTVVTQRASASLTPRGSDWSRSSARSRASDADRADAEPVDDRHRPRAGRRHRSRDQGERRSPPGGPITTTRRSSSTGSSRTAPIHRRLVADGERRLADRRRGRRPPGSSRLPDRWWTIRTTYGGLEGRFAFVAIITRAARTCSSARHAPAGGHRNSEKLLASFMNAFLSNPHVNFVDEDRDDHTGADPGAGWRRWRRKKIEVRGAPARTRRPRSSPRGIHGGPRRWRRSSRNLRPGLLHQEPTFGAGRGSTTVFWHRSAYCWCRATVGVPVVGHRREGRLSSVRRSPARRRSESPDARRSTSPTPRSTTWRTSTCTRASPPRSRSRAASSRSTPPAS